MAPILTLLVGLWLVAAFVLDKYGQRPAPRGQRWDAIVVLGCRVYASGEPSPALAARVRLAVQLYRAGYAPKIVTTGGPGDGDVSEADAAADLAKEFKVPESALIREDRSTSTEENAAFARERLQGTRVLLVTDAYHVFRSERVFGRYFEAARGVGSLNLPSPRLYGALREVAAVAAYAVLGRL